jgi:CRP-like cAMP-binding protein
VVLLRSGDAGRSERAETDDAISGALFGARVSAAPREANDTRHSANADVFAGLPRHVFADLLSQSGWRAFAPGEHIARAGKPTDGLLLVVSGRAQVTLPDQAGGTWSVGEVGQDDLLGVLEWVEGEAWATDVIAHTRVELRVLGAGALNALRRRYPAVDRAMADEAERQEARLRVIGCALFAALSLDEQEALSRRVGIRTLIDGEALFSAGEDTEGVALVGRGQLQVVGADGALVTRLGPGSAVGVQAAIQGGRARWTVLADPQARLYDLDAVLVKEVLANPAVRRAFEIQAARRRTGH